MHRSMYLYISTEGICMHRVTSTGNYTVKTVIQERTNEYYRYRRYETKRYIGTDVLGKVRKGISYADALQQGS